MDKEDIVYTHWNIIAIKKNGVLPFATAWMDLEGVMLSEISQTEKDKHCKISLMCNQHAHTTYTQWSITRQSKRMKSCHLEQHRWNYRLLC